VTHVLNLGISRLGADWNICSTFESAPRAILSFPWALPSGLSHGTWVVAREQRRGLVISRG